MKTHTPHIRLYRKLDLLKVIETPAAEWLRFNLQREEITTKMTSAQGFG